MSDDVLRFAVPNGSLWERLVKHLETAGYPLRSPERTGFCGEKKDENSGRTVIEFYQLDRRMLPHFLATGNFHAGLTGHDLWLNSGVKDLRSIGQFCFSRTSDQPSRWVLATKAETLLEHRNIRIACELPLLAEILLRSVSLPCTYSVQRIDGSEEQCVKYGIADAVLVVTETGNSIKANGLRIVDGCESLLVSMPEIRAHYGLTDAQEDALQGMSVALQAHRFHPH